MFVAFPFFESSESTRVKKCMAARKHPFEPYVLVLKQAFSCPDSLI